MITELLEAEEAAGHLTLPLPPAVLGLAIVRLCDAHLYAHLLGNDKPEIGTALQLVAARAQFQPTRSPSGCRRPGMTP